MRTKNLNLKKKIAFIASVAMIATTAAYLPQGVVNELNIGNSIVASADYASAVNLFQTYVKVNGKFLAVLDAGTPSSSTPKYKTFTSVDAIGDTDGKYIPVDVDTTIKPLLAGNDVADYADVFSIPVENQVYTDAVELPSCIKPTDVVTIAVVGNKADGEGGEGNVKRGVVTSDTTEFTVVLDDNGFGQIKKKSAKVEITGANYVENEEGVESGDREKVDLSGLKFVVGFEANEDCVITAATLEGATAKIGTTDVKGTLAKVADGITPAAAASIKDVKSYYYAQTKVDGIYAQNIVLTLNAFQDPGKTVVVDLKPAALTKITGTNVEDKGKVSITLGSDGTGSSGLITVKEDYKTEYYVITVVNAANPVKAKVISENVKTVGLCAGTLTDATETKRDSKQIALGNKVNTAEEGQEAVYVTYPQNTGDIKVKSEQVKKSVKGQEKYIEQITVYSNDPVADYSAKEGSETKDRKKGFKVLFDFVPSFTTTSNPVVKYYTTADRTEVSEAKTKYATVTWKNGSKLEIQANATGEGAFETDAAAAAAAKEAAASYLVMYPDSNKGANFSTDQNLVWKDGDVERYFNIKFTTEYELPVFDGVNTADLDGAANFVQDPDEFLGWAKVNALKVTKPEAAKQGGYLFKQWMISTDDAAVQIYGADSAYQTTNSTTAGYTFGENEVTPNRYIYADYDANEYKVRYNGNGGTLAKDADAGVSLTPVKADENGNVVQFMRTNSVKTNTTGESKIAESDSDDSGVAATRSGYKFKGWSTDPNAEEAMTVEELEDAKPTEKNGVLDLYAVWKSNKVTVDFGFIGFDKTGRSLAGTNEADYKMGEESKIIFNKDSSVEYKSDKAFGKLPSPTLRGYTFDGWFIKKETINSKNQTEYSLKRVDETTIIDSTLYEKDQVGIDGGKLKLYAKFKQNEYNVETDLDGGKLYWKEGAKPSEGDEKTYVWDGIDNVAVTKEQYKESPAPIATYKYNAAAGEDEDPVIFYDELGNDITNNVKNVYEVRKGSGKYEVFQGFYINDDTSANKFSNLGTALNDFAKLGNLKLKAVYDIEKENSEGSIFFDTCEGTFYQATNTSFTAPGALVPSTFAGGNPQPKDTRVGSYLTVKNNTVRCDSLKDEDNSGYFFIARPGYTFTGWYEDPECTKQFNFTSAQYKGGTEIKVYAGWKADTITRYHLVFNILGSDGSFVTYDPTAKDGVNPGGHAADISENNDDVNASKFEFYKTYYDTTDTIINAATYKNNVREIEYNGKSYVFDTDLSNDCKSENKLEAEFAEDKLNLGKFELDSDKYTVVEGIFVPKGTESGPKLEAPTNISVKGNVVTWTGCEAAVEYQVKKMEAGKKPAYTAWTKDTKATLKNVPDDTYTVAVVARDKDKKTITSAEYTVVHEDTEKLEAPTNVKVSDKGEVTWSAAKGATQYQVLKVVDGDKVYTGKTTELKAQLKSTASDYDVYVIAFDANGKSIRSEKVTGKAFTNGIAAVKDAKYDASTGKITWTPVEGGEFYQVCTIVNGNKSYSKYVTTGEYEYPKDKKPTGVFSFYVIAKDANKKNAVSGTRVKVTNKPSVTKVELADDNKSVSFEAVEGAKSYQLCKRVPGKKDAFTDYFTTTTKSFKNACTSGTQVYVIAFFDDEHTQENSSWSEAIIVK